MKSKKSIAILLIALCVISIVSISFPTKVADAAVVRYGSSGSEVKQIQQKLKSWGYYTGSVDGIFGSKTREAVRYFQRKL